MSAALLQGLHCLLARIAADFARLYPALAPFPDTAADRLWRRLGAAAERILKARLERSGEPVAALSADELEAIGDAVRAELEPLELDLRLRVTPERYEALARTLERDIVPWLAGQAQVGLSGVVGSLEEVIRTKRKDGRR